MLPGKHDGRGWPSIWKKLLSGQRPGTGDCITPSYKEGKSCICLSLNKTVISSSGTREEAEDHAAPISSLEPGLWYLVFFNIEHYFNASERIWLNFTADLVLCSVRRTEDYRRTDRRQKHSTVLRQHHMVSFQSLQKCHCLLLIQWILCHSAGILLSKKDEIQSTIFSLGRKMFLCGRKNQGTAHSEI